MRRRTGMSKKFFTPTLLADFYKISHREQYPEGTETIFSTWTARTSRKEGVNEVVAFGFQAFIKEYLIDYFKDNFFSKSKEEIVDEYTRVIKYTLGKEIVDTRHIEELHELGYLPIKIKAVPEGTLVPIRVPMLTIENTNPKFFWVTNFLETLMSCQLWLPTTSATIAYQYRKILDKYASETNGDLSGVQFQGHNFSMRGMGSLESAMLSGSGHLLSFTGTDTIPAIHYLEQYYNANIENELVGCSIPATEHSVMCTYGRENEIEAYKRLITEVYPTGFASIVSDTWNLWEVLDKIIKPLKNEIMNRKPSHSIILIINLCFFSQAYIF
jgi:nicotinamide phosphoribosyltransferase